MWKRGGSIVRLSSGAVFSSCSMAVQISRLRRVLRACGLIEFSTRTLLQIVCVLGAVVVMKVLSAHYDFSWASALAAE